MAFKRMNPGVDSLSQFLAQIPSLVNNYIQSDIRAKELAADRAERKANRESDIALKEKWRAEDLVNNEKKFEKNQLLTYKIGMRKDLLTMLESKQTELDGYMKEWETIGMEVDDQYEYNQTQEFKAMITREPKKVLEEISGDISVINNMINDIDTRINKYVGKNRFINNVRFEIQKHGDGYKYVTGTPEELDSGMTLWTQDDMNVVVDNILSDEDFITENKDHLATEYGQEYINKLREPGAGDLRKLNEEIFTHESKKFAASTSMIENKLKRIAYTAKGDPSVIQAQFIAEQLSALDTFEQALDHLPGFKDVENKLLVAHDQYAIDINSIPNKLSTTESIAEYYLEATGVGYIQKNSTNKENWNRATAEQYLKWRAGITFSRSSGVALILGPARAKEIFAQEKKSNSQLMNHLARLIVDVDNYTSADDATKRKIENQWGIRIGTATNLSSSNDVNTLLGDLKGSLSLLLGAEDVEMKDTEFMLNYGRMRKGEQQIREMQSYAPKDFMNYQDSLQGKSYFNTDNELETEIMNQQLSCTAGQTWNDALGMCWDGRNLPDNSALATPPTIGDNTYYGNLGGGLMVNDGQGNLSTMDPKSAEYKRIKNARETTNERNRTSIGVGPGQVKVNPITGHVEARY